MTEWNLTNSTKWQPAEDMTIDDVVESMAKVKAETEAAVRQVATAIAVALDNACTVMLGKGASRESMRIEIEQVTGTHWLTVDGFRVVKVRCSYDSTSCVVDAEWLDPPERSPLLDAPLPG
jgi:hypothetical protein